MARLRNMARMSVASAPGTGTVTLGSAVTGWLSFSSAGIQDGEVVTYFIVDGAAREIGRGTYTASGTTLARTTILRSTNANSAISATAAAQVAIGPSAEDFLREVNAQTGTTYTVLGSDLGKRVTFSNGSAVAVTLPQATGSGLFSAGYYFEAINLGAGTVTITPTTSTINGQSTVVLKQYEAATVVSDGTNYTAILSAGVSNLGTGVATFLKTPSSANLASAVTDKTGTGALVFATSPTLTTPIIAGVTVNAVREVLAAARTYYVRIDGSNSNTGLADTAGGAFLTIQKAIDTAAALDLGLHNVTVNVAAGEYTGAVTLKPFVTGGGKITISGAGATTIISTTSAHAVSTAVNAKGYILSNMKIQTTTAGNCIYAINFSEISVGAGLEFGSCAGYHVRAEALSSISFSSAYTISGGAQIHYNATSFGNISAQQSATVTLTGTPAFSVNFAYTDNLGLLVVANITWSGSATGARYFAGTNSVIQTFGSGASYLPGNSAGSTSTGGQYS